MAAILIALPDAGTAMALQQALAGQGHPVVVAITAESAVRAAQGVTFDLVITDDRLPAAAGRPLLGWLRSQPQHAGVQALVLSGTAEAVPASATRHLPRPVPLHAVLTAAHEALARLDGRPDPLDPARLDAEALVLSGPAGRCRLTLTELRLLRLLAASRQPAPLAVLRSLLAGTSGQNAVRVHLTHLRRKLAAVAGERAPRIVAESGGYTLQPASEGVRSLAGRAGQRAG